MEDILAQERAEETKEFCLVQVHNVRDEGEEAFRCRTLAQVHHEIAVLTRSGKVATAKDGGVVGRENSTSSVAPSLLQVQSGGPLRFTFVFTSHEGPSMAMRTEALPPQDVAK